MPHLASIAINARPIKIETARMENGPPPSITLFGEEVAATRFSRDSSHVRTVCHHDYTKPLRLRASSEERKTIGVWCVRSFNDHRRSDFYCHRSAVHANGLNKIQVN